MDPLLRKILNGLAAPLIMSLIILSLAATWKLTQQRLMPGEVPTINASGEGKVRVKPDVAVLSFAVVNQGTDPEVLQKGNDARMKAAIEFLKSQGVKDEDIKTTGYNLAPQYESEMVPSYPRNGFRPPRIVGYTLTQTVSAKIRELDKAGEIVGDLSERGVNQINSILFTVDDPTPYKAQARQEAIAKARKEALSIASGLGVRLGKVISFYESPIFIPRPIPLEAGYGGFGKGGDLAASPVQPGTEEISLTITITYTIR